MMTFGLTLSLQHKLGQPAIPALRERINAWWNSAPGREGSLDVTDWTTDEGHVTEFRNERFNAEESGIWTTELRAYVDTVDAPNLLLTIVMDVQSGDPWIRPIVYRVKSPGLLPMIPGVFDVAVSGETCLATPEVVDTKAKLEALVLHLQDQSRRVPFVVVSETQDQELILPNLDVELAERLFGIAKVARLCSLQAQQFTNRVGKDMSCFHGGVRLYWPQWATESSPFVHRLFTRSAILEGTDGDLVLAWKRLLGKLMTHVARATVVSFDYPSPIAQVIREARDTNHTQEPVDTSERCNLLEKQLEQAHATISLLERRLAQHESQVGAATPTEPEPSQWDYTPEEAVAAARLQFKPLVVLPDSLTTDGTVSGGTVYFFLKSLNELCTAVREENLEGGLANSLKAILSRNGIGGGYYKPGPTGVLVQLLDGAKKECRSRYHLKSGAPNETQSVYWADGGNTNSERYFVVASIGVHA